MTVLGCKAARGFDRFLSEEIMGNRVDHERDVCVPLWPGLKVVAVQHDGQRVQLLIREDVCYPAVDLPRFPAGSYPVTPPISTRDVRTLLLG